MHVCMYVCMYVWLVGKQAARLAASKVDLVGLAPGVGAGFTVGGAQKPGGGQRRACKQPGNQACKQA